MIGNVLGVHGEEKGFLISWCIIFTTPVLCGTVQ